MPNCKNCNREMRNAEFLMIGIKFKCFNCDKHITCQEWFKNTGEKT